MTKPTADWSYEYLPYTVTDENGTESDLPNFRIFPDDDPELYIAETNEHLPGDLQETHAQLISTSPQMYAALQAIASDEEACTCASRSWYGKGHDTQCPIRLATDVLALATPN